MTCRTRSRDGPTSGRHLSFDRANRKLQRRQLSGPRARTIHHNGSGIAGPARGHSGHAPVCQKDIGDTRSRGNVHPALARGFQRGRGKRPRIHAAFLQINGRQV